MSRFYLEICHLGAPQLFLVYLAFVIGWQPEVYLLKTVWDMGSWHAPFVAFIRNTEFSPVDAIRKASLFELR